MLTVCWLLRSIYDQINMCIACFMRTGFLLFVCVGALTYVVYIDIVCHTLRASQVVAALNSVSPIGALLVS